MFLIIVFLSTVLVAMVTGMFMNGYGLDKYTIINYKIYYVNSNASVRHIYFELPSISSSYDRYYDWNWNCK